MMGPAPGPSLKYSRVGSNAGASDRLQSNSKRCSAPYQYLSSHPQPKITMLLPGLSNLIPAPMAWISLAAARASMDRSWGSSQMSTAVKWGLQLEPQSYSAHWRTPSTSRT